MIQCQRIRSFSSFSAERRVFQPGRGFLMFAKLMRLAQIFHLPDLRSSLQYGRKDVMDVAAALAASLL